MMRDYLNLDEFKIAGEVPLLIKLHLRHLLAKKPGASSDILIVDTCIIGDFIATLPALRLFIKMAHQDVDVVVSPQVRSIAASIKGVRTVFTAKSIYTRDVETHAEFPTLPRHYERVLVLRISPDAVELLKPVRYSILNTYGVIFLTYFAHLVWNIALKREVRQWREVNFQIAGIEVPERVMTFDDIFQVSEDEYDQVRNLLPAKGRRKRIIIHTGSGWHVKLWDNDKWIDVIGKINKLGEFDFIFVGAGEFEMKSFDYIQERLDFKLHSLIDKADLKTILLLMRLSDFFIGIDSGPRNMAHLADLRSITLLGPAPKNFMPVNHEDIVIDKFTCRCKSLFYFHKVSAIHTISADEVLGGFRKWLASPAHVVDVR